MSISRRLYESCPKNALLATVQKIIIYSFFPLSLIVFFEAVVKNMILINLSNVVITVLNAAYGLHSQARAVQP
ncbi:MAG: hypothetical protein COT85_02660 [Chlamydiae bacterium CG10_big_fil_rev_8_21_14_0_10_42_34]|nr:MAG: hypothetical protein COT85_02660 [Chlamydiae bacterium CG10_big_fil_rev_8_21_14_0_10_42_34]